MNPKLIIVAAFVVLSFFPAKAVFAQSGVGTWEFHSDSDSDSIITATCRANGTGSYYLQGANYPARCRYSGSKITISVWSLEEMIGKTSPAIKMQFTINGDYISGSSVLQGGESYSGRRQGTDGKTSAQLVEANLPGNTTSTTAGATTTSENSTGSSSVKSSSSDNGNSSGSFEGTKFCPPAAVSVRLAQERDAEIKVLESRSSEAISNREKGEIVGQMNVAHGEYQRKMDLERKKCSSSKGTSGSTRE